MRGTLTGRCGCCQRFQAVLIFGLMPRGRVWTAHAEGEHFTGGVSFLLNGTKQLGEQSDTSRGSISLGNKQVKHMRSISLQGKVVSAAFLTPHLPRRSVRCRRRTDLCETQSQLHAPPLTLTLCCLSTGYITDSLHPGS